MYKVVCFYLAITLVLFISKPASGQEPLRQKIRDAVAGYPGQVGLAMINLTSGDTLSFHGDSRYPMQSVFKFPIALAVVDGIEKGKYSLQQRIFVTKEAMRTGTWSPLAKRYPGGEIDITIEELLTFMVRDSDNNACDVLLKVLGGPQSVNRYVHSIGIDSMQIHHYELEMERAWDVQFDNWCTPWAMAMLLKKFHEGKLLTSANTTFVRTLMETTTTGPRRMKGQLPDVIIAHRTGSSGLQDGRMAAVNDVGIIRMSQNSYIVLAVFVTNAPEPMSSAEQIIARITKIVHDHNGTH